MKADPEVHPDSNFRADVLQELLEIVSGESELDDLNVGEPSHSGPLAKYLEAGLIHVHKHEGGQGEDAGQGETEVAASTPKVHHHRLGVEAMLCEHTHNVVHLLSLPNSSVTPEKGKCI